MNIASYRDKWISNSSSLLGWTDWAGQTNRLQHSATLHVQYTALLSVHSEVTPLQKQLHTWQTVQVTASALQAWTNVSVNFSEWRVVYKWNHMNPNRSIWCCTQKRYKEKVSATYLCVFLDWRENFCMPTVLSLLVYRGHNVVSMTFPSTPQTWTYPEYTAMGGTCLVGAGCCCRLLLSSYSSVGRAFRMCRLPVPGFKANEISWYCQREPITSRDVGE